MSKRTAKRFYTLCGLLFCAEDGRRLGGYGGGSGRLLLRLLPTLRRDQGIEPCDGPHTYGPTVESSVWEAISAVLRDPRTFMAEMEWRRGGAGRTEAAGPGFRCCLTARARGCEPNGCATKTTSSASKHTWRRPCSRRLQSRTWRSAWADRGPPGVSDARGSVMGVGGPGR